MDHNIWIILVLYTIFLLYFAYIDFWTSFEIPPEWFWLEEDGHYIGRLEI